jgi:outer membrane protein
MNRTLKSFITLTAFGAAALGLSAEPVLKIATVDIGKLLEGYYKSEQEVTKLKANGQKAQEELERMVKEGNQLGEQYKETLDQAKNTLLTAEARSKADTDSAKMLDELQRRQSEINTYKGNSERALQQQWANVRGVLIEEIGKKATEVAKAKGVTLVVDLHSGIVYSDAAFDITDEVMALINKDRPAAPPAAATPAAPAASAGSPAAATSEAPTVSVPGLAPKK